MMSKIIAASEKLSAMTTGRPCRSALSDVDAVAALNHEVMNPFFPDDHVDIHHMLLTVPVQGLLHVAAKSSSNLSIPADYSVLSSGRPRPWVLRR